ncbi:alpha/beta hydrolase [Paraoerskovia marina]|uniref:alpha/beta hydrolase n=1 Tax=Paraoerskovia marina TaxID=545619 RepID=UPI0009DD2F24|nr:alpha/beta hydrolase [Paraoerskovia marina]
MSDNVVVGTGVAGSTDEVFPTSDEGWVTDLLGPDYQRLTLDLGTDDEGDVVATLVRYRPKTDEPVRPARAVLYLHGWSDYFFQTGLAEYWHGQGVAFYALDLRKYGRSLRPGNTPGYVENLETYDDDLDAAFAVIRAELGRHASVMLVAHSTGGLTGVLWAERRPGVVSGIVLNSPWIEMQGSSVVRTVSTPAIRQIARFQPRAPLPNIDPGYFGRTMHVSTGGSWDYDLRWRPTPTFPVRGGWLNAIIDGQARVARGLHIDVPIVVLIAGQSLISPRWSEDMRSADIVLDVDALAHRAPNLGRVVTLVRVPGGVHDLALSMPAARATFYEEITRWSAAYGWR